MNGEAANGKTPLHEASVVGDGEIVKLLIQKEADVLSRDDSGFTPYQLAFRKGYKDVCSEATINLVYLWFICGIYSQFTGDGDFAAVHSNSCSPL